MKGTSARAASDSRPRWANRPLAGATIHPSARATSLTETSTGTAGSQSTRRSVSPERSGPKSAAFISESATVMSGRFDCSRRSHSGSRYRSRCPDAAIASFPPTASPFSLASMAGSCS